MKKIYTAPEAEVSKFCLVADILSASNEVAEGQLKEKQDDVVFYGFGISSGFGFD